MIEVPDFREKEEKGKADVIYKTLTQIAAVLAYIPDATLDKKIALAYPKTKEMKFPLGYELCNGQNGTDDLRKSFTNEFVYIQRVK